jgi:hypothetical protein
MLTLRLGSDIHHLLTFARFGAGGRVNDNAGTGGICVGVRPDGSFLSHGLDMHLDVLAAHPTTGVEFASVPAIPNYHRFVDFVLELHADLLHHDLVSWDISVDPNGEPVFIEHNFAGAMWLYQLTTCQPLFGDLTEAVLDYVALRLSDESWKGTRYGD